MLLWTLGCVYPFELIVFFFPDFFFYLSTKVRLVKAMVFPEGMYGCESWSIKKAEHWRIDAFEVWCWRRLESPLNCKEVKPVNPKGNQPWIFTGRTVAEAEAPVLWPPDAKSWLIRKDPEAGKDWRQEEKGMTEGEMVGWYHWLNGREFEQAPRDGEGQGSLACCSPWDSQESSPTPQFKSINSSVLSFLHIPTLTSIHDHWEL